MFSGNQKNRSIVAALSVSLVLVLTGCRFKLERHYPQPDLSGPPPQAPPTPNWKSKKGFIKAVGMLPGAETWARAFWTEDNKLFVAGIPVGLWSKYYEATEGKGSDSRCVERSALFYPLWDPKTGKTEAVKGHQYLAKDRGFIVQLPDSRLLIPGVKFPSSVKHPVEEKASCDPQYFDPNIDGRAFLEIYDFQKKVHRSHYPHLKCPQGRCFL